MMMNAGMKNSIKLFNMRHDALSLLLSSDDAESGDHDFASWTVRCFFLLVDDVLFLPQCDRRVAPLKDD